MSSRRVLAVALMGSCTCPALVPVATRGHVASWPQGKLGKAVHARGAGTGFGPQGRGRGMLEWRGLVLGTGCLLWAQSRLPSEAPSLPPALSPPGSLAGGWPAGASQGSQRTALRLTLFPAVFCFYLIHSNSRGTSALSLLLVCVLTRSSLQRLSAAHGPSSLVTRPIGLCLPCAHCFCRVPWVLPQSGAFILARVWMVSDFNFLFELR